MQTNYLLPEFRRFPDSGVAIGLAIESLKGRTRFQLSSRAAAGGAPVVPAAIQTEAKSKQTNKK